MHKGSGKVCTANHCRQNFKHKNTQSQELQVLNASTARFNSNLFRKSSKRGNRYQLLDTSATGFRQMELYVEKSKFLSCFFLSLTLVLIRHLWPNFNLQILSLGKKKKIQRIQGQNGNETTGLNQSGKSYKALFKFLGLHLSTWNPSFTNGENSKQQKKTELMGVLPASHCSYILYFRSVSFCKLPDSI